MTFVIGVFVGEVDHAEGLWVGPTGATCGVAENVIEVGEDATLELYGDDAGFLETEWDITGPGKSGGPAATSTVTENFPDAGEFDWSCQIHDDKWDDDIDKDFNIPFADNGTIFVVAADDVSGPDQGCAEEELTFTVTMDPPGHEANVSVEWDVDGGTVTHQGTDDVTVTWSSGGTKTVTAKIGTSSASWDVDITEITDLDVDKDRAKIGTPDAVFDFTATVDGPLDDLEWELSGPTSVDISSCNGSDDCNVDLTSADAGEYTITVSCGPNHEMSKDVAVVGLDDATGDDACINEDIDFEGTTEPAGNEDLIEWSGGESPSTGTGQTFTTKFSTTGSKTVTAKVGTDEIDVDVTVDKVVSVSGPNKVCVDEEATFTADMEQGSSAEVMWDVDGAAITNQTNQEVTVKWPVGADGNKTIKASCGSSSATKSVEAKPWKFKGWSACRQNPPATTVVNLSQLLGTGGSGGITVSVTVEADAEEVCMSHSQLTTASGSVTFNASDFTGGSLTLTKPVTLTANLPKTGLTVSKVCSASITINVDVCYPSGGNPVNLLTGEYNHSATDFLPAQSSSDLNLAFVRNYHSQTDNEEGALGVKWSNTFEISMAELDSTFVEYRRPDGQKLFFVRRPGGTYASPIANFSVLTKDTDGAFRLVEKDGKTTTFNSFGQPAKIERPGGDFLTFEYQDTTHRLLEVSDEFGRSLKFLYNDLMPESIAELFPNASDTEFIILQNGLLREMVDPLGRATLYHYDQWNNLVRVTRPTGLTAEYRYNATDTMPGHYMIYRSVPWIDQRYPALFVEYDRNGRALNELDARGNVIFSLQTTVDTARLQIRSVFTDEDGHTGEVLFDDRFFVIESKNKGCQSCGGLGGTNVKNVVDDNGNILEKIDANGNTTKWTYDNRGNRLTQVDPLGNREEWQYEPVFNKVIRQRVFDVTGPLVWDRAYEYDPNGRVIRETQKIDDSASRTRTIAWLDHNLKTSETDFRGNVTRYEYNAFGYPSRILRPLDVTQATTYDAVGRLVESTDPLGRTTKFLYDDLDHPLKTIRPDGVSIESVYDTYGNVVSRNDPNGNVWRFEYDFNTRDLMRQIDPLGGSTQFAYTFSGRKAVEVDPLGRTTTYSYDDQGRPAEVVRDANGLKAKTANKYDSQGNLIEQVDPNGVVTRLTYDSLNRAKTRTEAAGTPVERTISQEYDPLANVIRQTDGRGHATAFRYDLVSRLVETTDPLGGTTRTEYDVDNNVTAKTDANGHTARNEYDALSRRIKAVDPLGAITTIAYDANSNQTSVTDALGHTTTFKYDALDRQIRTTDALGQITQTEYDANGNQIAVVDAKGNTTRSEFDVLNRVVKQTDAVGSVRTFQYNAVGRQTVFTDARGNTTRSEYDGLHRLVNFTDPEGHAQTFTYDLNGNVLSTTDGLGNVATSKYDALNRQVETADPLGNKSINAYDASDNRVSTIDPNGNTTQYEFDALNRLTAVVDAQSGRTEYTYDGVGNRLTIKDANGHVTKMAYDANNRQVREEYPNGNVTVTVYDIVGDVLTMTDANGVTKTMAYDAIRRLVSEDFPGDTQDVEYTYDANGNQTSMQFWLNGAQTTFSREYDALNRGTKSVQGDLGEVSYTYDRNGNRATMTGPDGKVTAYTYDKANRLVKLRDWKGEEYAFEYDAANRRTKMTYPNGTVQSYEFDAASRVLAMRNHTSADAVIADFTYTYDAQGNRLTKTNDQGLHEYGYDKLNRLVTAKSVPDGNSAYVYDPVGNRLTLTKDSQATNNTFDADNRQLSFDGVVFGYDANGNQTKKSENRIVTDYGYDYRNRLVEVSRRKAKEKEDDGRDHKDNHRGKSGEFHGRGKDEGHGEDDEHAEEMDGKEGKKRVGAFQAGYAPDGSRMFKVENGIVTFFIYDFEDIIAEIDTIGQIKRRITHGPGIDEPLSITDISTGKTHYLHYDALGSVVAVTDAAQSVVERYHYNAFGNRLEQSAFGVSYSFTAREWDVSAALYYYRSRQYDPTQGRFTRKDQFGGISTEPRSLHRYIYAYDAPISNRDPWGFIPVGITVGNVTEKSSTIDITGTKAVLFCFKEVTCKISDVEFQLNLTSTILFPQSSFASLTDYNLAVAHENKHQSIKKKEFDTKLHPKAKNILKGKTSQCTNFFESAAQLCCKANLKLDIVVMGQVITDGLKNLPDDIQLDNKEYLVTDPVTGKMVFVSNP